MQVDVLGSDEMDPEEAFQQCLSTICCDSDPDKVQKAWNTLEDAFGHCNSYDKFLRSVLTEMYIRNVEEVPKVLEWFTKFPCAHSTSRPLSDDIAVFLIKHAIMFKNKPSLLANIIRVMVENKDDYLPPNNNHTELCKSIVHVLSWIHLDDRHPETGKERAYKDDLGIIIEFLHDLSKITHSGSEGNTSVACFNALYEILIHNDRKEYPSSILVIVLKLVDDELWNLHMSVAASHIIQKTNGQGILRMMEVMHKWLIKPPHSNMKYLSHWLMLFIQNLETTGRNRRIPMDISEACLPFILAPALKIEEFYEIDPSRNVVLYLMRQICSQSSYHRTVKYLIPFLLECEDVTGNKKVVIINIIQIYHHLRNRFQEHLRTACDICDRLDSIIDKLAKGCPLDNCDEEMDVSYSGSSNIVAKSSSGKAGLLNLGNTCYMNSVLQALAMTRQFCHEVLLYKNVDLNSQFVLKNLQQIFALLKFSVKNALAPTEFLQASRPAYFMQGQQQDSSEFLCHLLDVLYEQEKSTLSVQCSNQISKKVIKTEDVEMESTDIAEASNTPMLEGGVSGNMTRWTTEENLSEGASLQRKTQSLADFSQGEDLAQTQNGLSDSHSDSTDSGIQSVGGEDSTASSTSSPTSTAGVVPSLVHRVFGGELQVIYRCQKCDTESCNTDRFRDLQLCFLDSMPSEDVVTVQDLINANYTQPEDLKGDNQYRCDKCATLRDATRAIKFIQAPAHLILTLKHFKYDAESRLRTKQRRRVDYNEIIHLPVVDKDNEEYQLYAAVVHSGYSMDFGHYITYACDEKKQWYKFNDGYVGETTIADFKRLHLPDTPYILFYKRSTPDETNTETLELSSLHKELREFVEADNHEHVNGRHVLAGPSTKRFGPNRSWDRDKSDEDDEGNSPPSNCRSAVIIPDQTCLY